jgi:hypothetical protein
MPLLIALLLSVVLGAPFGTAEATAVSTTGGLTLEVTVEVNAAATAVLVRPVGFGTELPPVALGDQGDGTWLGIVELTAIDNIQVVFELIPSNGPSTVSAAHTLTELGVDQAVFESQSSASTSDAQDEEATVNRQWIWLALAAGAAGLALLVVWAFWDRNENSDQARSQPHEASRSGALDDGSGNADNSGDGDGEPT